MVQTTMRIMMPMMVVVTGLRALPSRVRLSIHRRTPVSIHRAIWNARAMNQPWDMVDSQRGDNSTVFRAMSSEKARISGLLVPESSSAAIPRNLVLDPVASLLRRRVTIPRMARRTR